MLGFSRERHKLCWDFHVKDIVILRFSRERHKLYWAFHVKDISYVGLFT
jgi:hypothetical protein